MDEALKVIISAETAKLRNEVEKAKKEVKDFSKDSEEALKAYDESMEKAKEATKKAMTGIAAACAATVAAMVGVAESTREFRTNQAKLAAAFETAGTSAEVATKTYEDLYRVLGDDDTATEAAQQLANITSNEKDLAQYTKICQGVFAKWGNSIESAGFAEAINHTIELGEVQGTLADALEWAGESVDEFNEELAKCNSTAEREQKVREKLNKLYAKSADNYEKNSKEILEANEAQLRLTKSLANIGKSVEPVITAFKDFGATLLEDAEEPIADICEWITDDLIPGLKETIDWVKQNKDAIVPALSAITAGYVTYKAAVFASELATQGLTIATYAQITAQKILDTIMKSNPYALAAAAIAALVAGMVTAMVQYEENIKTATNLNEAELELIETSNKRVEALAKQKEASQQAAGEIMSQMGYVQSLSEELQRLADAQGKVEEKDRARADFILGELNTALGTEYSMVDGVIQQYGRLVESIEGAIQAKTAELLLEEFQDDYVAAIKAKADAYGSLSLAQKDYDLQLEKIGQREQELQAIRDEMRQKELDGTYTFNADLYNYDLNRLLNAQTALDDEKKILSEREKALGEASVKYGEISNTIVGFEEAQKMAMQGNYDAAIELLAGKAQAYGDWSGKVDKETDKVLNTLAQEAIDAGYYAEEVKANWENGVDGYTEEMVKEAEKGYEDAMKEFETAYADAMGVGEDLGSGVEKGMANKEGGLFAKARSLVKGIIAAMRKESDSHSPSRKTMALGSDMGEGTEIGISKSTKDVVKSATVMIDASLKPMEESIKSFQAKNLNGVFDISTPNIPTGSSLKPINDNASRLESLMSKYSSNGTPIVLKVGEKVLAETTISSINQLTKETGDIPLLLMV